MVRNVTKQERKRTFTDSLLIQTRGGPNPPRELPRALLGGRRGGRGLEGARPVAEAPIPPCLCAPPRRGAGTRSRVLPVPRARGVQWTKGGGGGEFAVRMFRFFAGETRNGMVQRRGLRAFSTASNSQEDNVEGGELSFACAAHGFCGRVETGQKSNQGALRATICLCMWSLTPTPTPRGALCMESANDGDSCSRASRDLMS